MSRRFTSALVAFAAAIALVLGVAGSGFTSDMVVTIGGQPALLTAVTGTRAALTVPAPAPGT